MHGCVLSHFSHVQLFAIPFHQAPLSMGSNLCLTSPLSAGGFLTTCATWEIQGAGQEARKFIF